jgi:exosome complex component RRP4
LIKITPSKIPRLIGRKGSMINMIKNKTNCMIIAGQNGWVWIKGESLDEMRAAKAINLIDEQSHVSGLTDKIEQMLKR